jgi:predicted DNA-binding transcriptional regulator AlpA
VSEPLNSAKIALADEIATRVVEMLIRMVARAAISPPQNERAVIGANGGPPTIADDDETAVFDIPGFCRWAKISRSTLYQMWEAGTGPRFFKAGTAVRITKRSGRDWFAEREAAASEPVAPSGRPMRSPAPQARAPKPFAAPAGRTPLESVR